MTDLITEMFRGLPILILVLASLLMLDCCVQDIMEKENEQ